MIFTVVALVSTNFIPNSYFYRPPFERLILYIGLIAVVYNIFSVIFVKLLRYELRIDLRNTSKRRILLYSLPCIFSWTLYWIAFFPAGMSYDSLDQWGQIQSLRFNDWHPVPHTIFEWVVTRIWNSPAMIAITQILILSFVIGYGIYSLEKAGAKKVALYLATIILALNPVNGVMSVMLWKDIIYSAFLLLFTTILFNIVTSNAKWVDKKVNLALFIGVCFGIVFFRHNGILPFAFTLLLLIVWYRKYSKRFGLVFISVMVVYFTVRGPIYALTGVVPAQSGEDFGVAVNQIGAVVKEGGHITNQQKEELDKILPLHLWGKNYNPFSTNPLKFDESFNVNRIAEDKASFLKLWFGIVRNNSKIAIKSYSRLSSLTWQVFEDSQGYTYTFTDKIGENQYGLKNIIVSDKVNNVIRKALEFSQESKVKALFWRPALPFLFILFFGLVSAIRNSMKMCIVLAPVILNHLSVMIAIPAQDFRYLYANTIISVVIILISFLNIPIKK